MKQVFICFLVAILCCCGHSFAQTQQQLGKVKERIKKELTITDVKADSVVTILKGFLTNAKAIRTSTTLSDTERKTALQNERKEELARLKTHLSQKQIKQLQEIVRDYMAQKKGGKKAGNTRDDE